LTKKERLLESSWTKELLYLSLALLRRKQKPTVKSTTTTTIGTAIARIIEILRFPVHVHHFLRHPINKVVGI